MKLAGKIAVFWTVQTGQDPLAHGWAAQELKQGRLRQGWGVEGFRLTDGSTAVPEQEWARRALIAARKAWPHDVHTEHTVAKRFKILRRLIDLRLGDRIVVPHMPCNGFITLATVSCVYNFDLAHGYPIYGNMDFGHVIGVDPARLVALPFNTSDDSIHVTSQFSYYRSAVNMIRSPIHQAAVMRLFEKHLA